LLAGQFLLTRSRPAGDGLQTGCVSGKSCKERLTPLTLQVAGVLRTWLSERGRGPGGPSSPPAAASLLAATRSQLVAKASRGRLTADQSNLSLVMRKPLP